MASVSPGLFVAVFALIAALLVFTAFIHYKRSLSGCGVSG